MFHSPTASMKLAIGERNVATNLGIIFRLCWRILFYYLNYQPNERFQGHLDAINLFYFVYCTNFLCDLGL